MSVADVGVIQFARQRSRFAPRHFLCCDAKRRAPARRWRRIVRPFPELMRFRDRSIRFSDHRRRRFRSLRLHFPAAPVADARVGSVKNCGSGVLGRTDDPGEQPRNLGRIEWAEAGDGIVREVPLVLRQSDKIADRGIAAPGAAKRRTGQRQRHARFQEIADVGAGRDRFDRRQGSRDRRAALASAPAQKPARQARCDVRSVGLRFRRWRRLRRRRVARSRSTARACGATSATGNCPDRSWLIPRPSSDRAAPALPGRRDRACRLKNGCST